MRAVTVAKRIAPPAKLSYKINPLDFTN